MEELQLCGVFSLHPDIKLLILTDKLTEQLNIYPVLYVYLFF